jgi:hypothetical protein
LHRAEHRYRSQEARNSKTTGLWEHINLQHADACPHSTRNQSSHLHVPAAAAAAVSSSSLTVVSAPSFFSPRATSTSAYLPTNSKFVLACMYVLFFLVTSFSAVCLVENEWLRGLLSLLDPRFVLPHRSWFWERITAAAVIARALIKKQLSEARYVSLTTDCWTSCAGDSYLTLTAHWVALSSGNGATKLKMHRATLATREVLGSHTAEVLFRAIAKICVEYGLVSCSLVNDVPTYSLSRISAVTSDNGANIVSCVALLTSRYVICAAGSGVRCIAHTLQLCVNDIKVYLSGVFFS